MLRSRFSAHPILVFIIAIGLIEAWAINPTWGMELVLLAVATVLANLLAHIVVIGFYIGCLIITGILGAPQYFPTVEDSRVDALIDNSAAICPEHIPRLLTTYLMLMPWGVIAGLLNALLALGWHFNCRWRSRRHT